MAVAVFEWQYGGMAVTVVLVAVMAVLVVDVNGWRAAYMTVVVCSFVWRSNGCTRMALEWQRSSSCCLFELSSSLFELLSGLLLIDLIGCCAVVLFV